MIEKNPVHEIPTPEHDRLQVWLLKNWKTVAERFQIKRAYQLLLEEPFEERYRPTVFADAVITTGIRDRGYYVAIFEIKPKIESVGQTIRQIKNYATFLPHFFDQMGNEIEHSLLFLLTEHSSEFDEVFNSQGINVIRPSDFVDEIEGQKPDLEQVVLANKD